MYGLLISLAIVTSVLVAEKISKKESKNTDFLWGSLVWVIGFGLIGARLYHVFDYWGFYSSYPAQILQIWHGGLGIIGGIIGGISGLWLYTHLKKEQILYSLDLAALVMPLGQAIGRWGNFFNGELFGLPTTLSWGLYVKPENRPTGYGSATKFHPLFLYESLLSLLLFAVLLGFYKKGKVLGKGFFLTFYLAGYSIIRFFLEFLRLEDDIWRVGGLNVAQCVSILGVIGSIIFYESLHRRRSQRVSP